MVGILITGMIGLTIADQQDFLDIFQSNGGFAMKPGDLKQVSRELRATVPTLDKTEGTVVPLRSTGSKDPRAQVIQEVLDASLGNE